MHDGEQYTKILLRHKKLIWRLCRRYAKHDAKRCSDLVQEVSIALWEYYGRLQPDAGTLEETWWVLSVTRLVLRNMHRHKREEEQPMADWMADTIADNSNNDSDRVQELLAELPEEDRRLIQLRLDGYSGSEIGEIMGLKRDAVYQRIKRIIDKLKQISNER
jgi:RNA polymerase sigma factor (sigma-70 family)